MADPQRNFSRLAIGAAAALLPAILLFSALRTFQSLAELRSDLLRNRAATLANRLEAQGAAEASWDMLAELEPALLDLEVFQPGGEPPADPNAAAILEGRELYRILRVEGEQVRIFRAYVPFHRAGATLVARIDLDEAAADSILVHARHNVIIATLSGIFMLGMALFLIRNARRRAELERAQLQMEHLAHLGRMSATLAHEIRNPLGTVKGFVQLAMEKADGATRPLLEPVLEEIRRMETLVRDLLLYGRTPSPVKREVGWEEIAARLKESAQAIVNGRNIDFQIADSGEKLHIDPELANQVLLNLVRNAAEAIGERRGSIKVWNAVTAQGAVIAVTDNGPGIPADAMGRIFESFYTTKAAGTGLGLPIARKLTEALGGKLEIENLPQGGVEARMVLPRR